MRLPSIELPTIASHADFSNALRWGFSALTTPDTRRIVCADPSFEHWPLDDVQLIEVLTAWLRLPQRRLVLLAADYGDVPRRHPRFTAWRRDWTHAVEAWQPPAEWRNTVPSVLCADGSSISVQLNDTASGTGRVSDESRRAQHWRDELDAFLQRCEPAFTSQVLGL